MNILFVTHDLDAGGAARSLSVLVPNLVAAGHSIRILSMLPPRMQRDPGQIYASCGVPVDVMPFPWISLAYVGVPAPDNAYPPHVRAQHAVTVRELRKYTPDVVCFNGYPPTSLAPYIKARRKVLIAREVVDESSPLLKQVVKSLKRNIDHAVAIGPVEERQLASWGIPVTTVYNTARVAPSRAALPGMPPVRFGCFGNMHEGKGQIVLTIAAAAVKDELRRTNTHVHIFGAGTGGLEETLALFVRQNGLEDVIHMEGWVNDVEAAMRSMHCIVRPDLTASPWGRDVIEAMSMGRPVLATGTEDVFVKHGRTGWLVPPNDPEALARVMTQLATAPDQLAQAGHAAFAFAQSNFDPMVNAARIAEIMSR